MVILLYAFTTDEQTFTFPLPGLTTRWFALATTRPDLWAAFGLSVQVALGATALALVLGTMAALAVANSRFFGREAVSFLVVLPLALPGIVTGIALRSTIGLMGIPFSIWTIVIGHATFCIVTVYNNVIARLRRTSGSLLEASMDLGADAFPDLPLRGAAQHRHGAAGGRHAGLRAVVRRDHRHHLHRRASRPPCPSGSSAS